MTFKETLYATDTVYSAHRDRLAAFVGWEPLTVGYYGSEGLPGGATPSQIELRNWLDRLRLDTVGDYYINVEKNFWIRAEEFNPFTYMEDLWKVLYAVKGTLAWSLAQEFGLYTFKLYWEEDAYETGACSASSSSEEDICLMIAETIFAVLDRETTDATTDA